MKPEPSWPRITLVMPNLNYAAYLAEAIESVVSQRYPNLEFIMVDGGSSDASLDIIEAHRDHFSQIIVEPDDGQADAINKGLARATGEIFQWLNSDDLLEPGALAAVARAMPSHDAVAGRCIDFHPDGREQPRKLRGLRWRRMIRFPASVEFHQPALWLRTDNVRACGGLDSRFHLMFDYDLTIRYLERFPRVRYLDAPLVRFRLHPTSKTTTRRPEFFRERRDVVSMLCRHPSPRLRAAACRMRDRMAWWDRLAAIEALPASELTRTRTLLVEALARPSLRFGRALGRSIVRIWRHPGGP